jgi:hypothetical protein
MAERFVLTDLEEDSRKCFPAANGIRIRAGLFHFVLKRGKLIIQFYC